MAPKGSVRVHWLSASPHQKDCALELLLQGKSHLVPSLQIRFDLPVKYNSHSVDEVFHKSVVAQRFQDPGRLRGIPAWCGPVRYGKLKRGGVGTDFQIGGPGRCGWGIYVQVTAKSGRASCGQVIYGWELWSGDFWMGELWSGDFYVSGSMSCMLSTVER
ncbi:hypothetical protein F2Q69_00008636 [Brassica cretica]|uniref:Uncharacterized protein n=1 Tax=Brassica cretica TaxID=69181 RepID=A0A8S9P635_BRACR|nr:hypothetical protein F2Q69_00008636 [Brassica cretica]